MIVRLYFTFRKKETSIMKRFFVNRLVKKFTTCWKQILREHYYPDHIQDATYQAQIEELEEGEEPTG